MVGISEIDEAAITAYRAVHGEDIPNYGDISKIDWGEVADFDLFTYSWPCTDVSQAGRQEGFAEGSGTRSSLLWECKRAITAKRPKYLLMENVKALMSGKFAPLLHVWQRWLEEQGYYNFARLLNAKDYGVPQNRERVFMVSIRYDGGDEPIYHFPKPFVLDKRMKDLLETDVAEGYFLSDKALEYFCRVNNDKTHGHDFTPKDEGDIAFTVRTRPGSRVDDNFVKHETE